MLTWCAEFIAVSRSFVHILKLAYFGGAKVSHIKLWYSQIIIEGVESDNDFEACSGVILNYGKKNGISDIVSRLNGFFGKNNLG